MDDIGFQDAAKAFAMVLERGPRLTLGSIKHNLNLAEYAPLEASFDNEALHYARAATTEDHREAAAAFVEKRQPVFTGRRPGTSRLEFQNIVCASFASHMKRKYLMATTLVPLRAGERRARRHRPSGQIPNVVRHVSRPTFRSPRTTAGT